MNHNRREGNCRLEAAWIIALIAVLLPAFPIDPSGRGDLLVRNSIRLSLAFYALSVLLLLRGANGDGLARRAWTLAWLTYLIHVALAFHYVHDWSHVEAMEHVRKASGVGEGLYASYLFTLLWTLDVIWWWARPVSHARRPNWLKVGLHGFILFMVFNATVVFETGIIRWAGVALFEVLGRQGLFRLCGKSSTTGGRFTTGVFP